MFQEQRITLCTSLAIAQGLVVGYNGSPTIPLNLQDFSNSGIPSTRAYDMLGVELSWTGNPVGTIQLQGNITGNTAAMVTLSAPGNGSQGEIAPSDSDVTFRPDEDGNVAIFQTPLVQVPNLVQMTGQPGAALLFWDLTKFRVNFIQLFETLASGAGNLTCTLSLRYQI